MAEWLKERKIESVAMESTGVYWIAPHEVLEKNFEVLLVDTRQLVCVTGRNKKTDPSDCEWIQRLHSCGLLNGSFRPQEQVCMLLRTLVRDKANLVQVVLTDRVLPDGDWRAVLEIVAQGLAYVQVVVCSRLRDHTLLIDVLEQGAYDVLVEPYQREEVRRVLEAAAARSCVLPRSLARMTSYKNKAAHRQRYVASEVIPIAGSSLAHDESTSKEEINRVGTWQSVNA